MNYKKIDRKFLLEGSDHLPSGLTIATTIFLPLENPRPIILFLFPGASYSRHYFDIQFGDGSYSEAAFHAQRGFVVVAVDHLATGESSLSGYDDYSGPAQRHEVTLTMLGAACNAVTRSIIAKLRDGSLDTDFAALANPTSIGIGQSMGGHVVAIAQANHATFDGVAILGSSFTQTRLPLRPGRNYPPRNCSFEELLLGIAKDCDMQAGFHWHEEPTELLAADENGPWRSKAIPICASQLLMPNAVAREAARVRVPVLLAYGEIDVTQEPLADVAMFRATCDIALLIVPRMAHMHNFAPTRQLLWRRLENFARQVDNAECVALA